MTIPTPDAAADAMNVLTYQQRVLYEAAGMLSEHSDCDDAAYLRKSLARACAIVRDLATRLHAAEKRLADAEGYAQDLEDHYCPRPTNRPPLTPQTTADAPANATNESEPRT